MKALKASLLTLISLFLIVGISVAQEKKASSQMYSVHEDVVKPNMAKEYESIAKELIAELTKHEIPEVKYLCAQSEGFRYLYVTPIDKMADLDKSYFSTLAEKMGSDQLGDLFNRMDKCYDKHGSYTITLDHDLSYMPEGMSQTQEGTPYRTYYEHHVTPANYKALTKAAMAVKEYHASHNSPMHYRVYRKGFGGLGDYFLVAISAKDPAHMAELVTKTHEAFGEDYGPLIDDIMNATSEFRTYNGWIRSDLSYSPKQ